MTDKPYEYTREFNNLGEAVNAIAEEVNNNLNHCDYEFACLKERVLELERLINDLEHRPIEKKVKKHE